MADILHAIILNELRWKIRIFIEISMLFVPDGSSEISQHWFDTKP